MEGQTTVLQSNKTYKCPPRPPKPQPKPEPMEVDQSIHSRRINYMNKPPQNQFQDTSSEETQSKNEYEDEFEGCNDVYF
ncbi:unnamed protein product [Ceratitis capitata]|uniref:(Mediterranean fruit fly) hypothetical protein n=1 Tax=Ceratitis capitata TaxID=7213 RepID=A0A811US70_CERCA|nr:unnamed protein product [Ceratitis capitata]